MHTLFKTGTVWPPEGKLYLYHEHIILIPWHGIHMHMHATFECVLGARGPSSRDNNMHVDHSTL